MTRPKHQHWVPQFYLKQFATSDTLGSKMPKVWVWEKDFGVSLPAPVSVRNVCGQRYLYSPEDKQGNRTWELEEYLASQEGVAAKLWPSLLSGEAPLRNEVIRGFLAEFIAVLHLRNVALFRTIDKVMELRDKLYGPPSEEFVGARKPSDPDPRHSGRHFVHTVIARSAKIVEQLIKKRWLIICTEERAFVTADRPVIYNPSAARPLGGMLIFPLSPSRVLCMDNEVNALRDTYCKATECAPQSMNEAINSNALRLVISSCRREPAS